MKERRLEQLQDLHPISQQLNRQSRIFSCNRCVYKVNDITSFYILEIQKEGEATTTAKGLDSSYSGTITSVGLSQGSQYSYSLISASIVGGNRIVPPYRPTLSPQGAPLGSMLPNPIYRQETFMSITCRILRKPALGRGTLLRNLKPAARMAWR